MSGWIKLHRTLIDWEWWDDHNATRLLIYLLCKVNHEQKRWKGIIIEPGTIVTSYGKLAEATGMSVKSVRVAMSKLEKSGEVARERAHEGQAVTLIKWDKLQQKKKKGAGKRATEGQDNGKATATTKECNNENNENKGISFDEFWNSYDKKVGRSKCEKMWININLDDQKKIMAYIPKYKLANLDKKFRKNPETFLRNKSWYDEIIERSNNGSQGQGSGKDRIATTFTGGL